MCNEAKNTLHQGASWLCCLATHDQTGWQHHELSGWGRCNYEPDFHFIKFHLQIYRILKCAYLENFIIINEDKIYFKIIMFHHVSMGNITKTF